MTRWLRNRIDWLNLGLIWFGILTVGVLIAVIVLVTVAITS